MAPETGWTKIENAVAVLSPSQRRMAAVACVRREIEKHAGKFHGREVSLLRLLAHAEVYAKWEASSIRASGPDLSEAWHKQELIVARDCARAYRMAMVGVPEVGGIMMALEETLFPGMNAASAIHDCCCGPNYMDAIDETVALLVKYREEAHNENHV